MSHDLSVNPGLSLGYTAVRLGHVLAGRFEAALAEHGLSLGQYCVLAYLAGRPDLSVGELSRLMAVTPQSVGAMLDVLADRGLVVRGVGQRGHRRDADVTPAGRESLAAATPSAEAVDQSLHRLLSADQPDQLRDTLFGLLRRSQA